MDHRIADLKQAGRIRVALYPPQYAKDQTGALRGWTIELGRALAERIGVEFVPVEYPTPPKAMESLTTGFCDVGFGAMEASRSSEVDFSPAVLQFDFTYLVPSRSPIQTVSDAHRSGVLVAVVLNHASTLCLSRLIKDASFVTAETPEAAFEILSGGHADAWASTRPALLEFSSKLPDSRVLEDCFGANFTAMIVPKGQRGRLAYISQFVEEAKSSGLIERAVMNSGRPRISPLGSDRGYSFHHDLEKFYG
jgi:polar amino acid transport system substrate-binding protein